ncbi:TPA: Y-family DNA polymerase [Pseudomonas aeruginosa]|nr:Y-family DNA polymerase [Pseudomonas aeruginosa]
MAVFALVDCHCFYVSAEATLDASLRVPGLPICALSNGDGAVVSRNDACKQLGVKMGQPFFEIKHLMKSHGLRVVSSNYALYQEISNRVMLVLSRFAPRIEIYSIDECWLDLTGISGDLEKLAHEMRKAVYQATGIPVGVGIGSSKTLAKAANFAAKKWKAKTDSVVVLLDEVKRDKLLKWMPANEIWGIGRRISAHLESMKIITAWDLSQYDKKTLRKHFNVNIEKTAIELTGVSCYGLQEHAEPKQTIASTRSFNGRVENIDGLREAVATYAARACVKLRSGKQLASCIQVFIQTSRFDDKPYSKAIIVGLESPSDDSREFVQAALAGLEKIFLAGYRYAKAGVILSQFSEAKNAQHDLFAPEPRRNAPELMKVLDTVNLRWGRGTIRIAREKKQTTWQMKMDFKSQNYLTSWNELKLIKC